MYMFSETFYFLCYIL